MTPERQRIACAELDGWNHTPTLNNPYVWMHSDGRRVRTYHDFPNYLNDLNAVHALEEKLMQDDELVDKLDNELLWDGFPWHLTAAQRVKAILRATGKWEEEE